MANKQHKDLTGSDIHILPGAQLRTLASTTAAAGVMPSVNSPLNSGCRVRLSAVQVIAAGSYQKITFDTEDWDTLGEFDSTTNYRFVASQSGKYMMTAQLYTASTTNLHWYACRNGSPTTGTATFGGQRPIGNSGALSLPSSDIVNVTTGDYFELWAESDTTGSTLTATTYQTYWAIQRLTD